MKIPRSVLKILATYDWKHDDYSCNQFNLALKHHIELDRKEGHTSRYLTQICSYDLENLTKPEINLLAKENAIHPDFYDENSVNQHYQHSLYQFFAEATKAYANHVKRTDKLIGTASGRIYRTDEYV
jgi:hypothetical protein